MGTKLQHVRSERICLAQSIRQGMKKTENSPRIWHSVQAASWMFRGLLLSSAVMQAVSASILELWVQILVYIQKPKMAIARKYFAYYANVSGYFESEGGGVGR